MSLDNPDAFRWRSRHGLDWQCLSWGLNGDGDLCLSGLINEPPEQLSLYNVTFTTGTRTHALFDSGGVVYAQWRVEVP